MKSLAVLLTVHNRKDKTLKCLHHLFLQKMKEEIQMDVYLTDDGCTDGTPAAVAKQFPSVKIIQGDGTLFWNRGMHLAWKTAAQTKDYDFYLWLNDDTMLYPHACQTVLNAAQATNLTSIICGATCSAQTGKTTYSGKNKRDGQMLIPNGRLQECDIVNGNFLLVPRRIFQTIGNLDWSFRHAIGDFDYGLRAKKTGFRNYVAPEYIGTCEQNPSLPRWCLKDTPLNERFRLLYSPLGYAEPIPFFIYDKRHFGLFSAIKHFCSINLRALFPQLWK
jgi:GT2 family glycosyltransferase